MRVLLHLPIPSLYQTTLPYKYFPSTPSMCTISCPFLSTVSGLNLMHIQGVWEGGKRENVQSEFISLFFIRTSPYSFQLCWWKKNLSWCCPGGPCRLQSIPLLGCRQHNLTEHRALSSQLSSGSALICRDINKSFSPDSSGGDVYSSCPVCFLLFTFCWQLPLPLPLEGQMCSQLSPNHWPMALQWEELLGGWSRICAFQRGVPASGSTDIPGCWL